MKKTILTLVVAFAIALSFVVISPSSYASTIDTDTSKFGRVLPGAYTVMLSNQTFTEIDQKFPDKEVVTASNEPDINSKVDPFLQHEYQMELAAVVYDKVEEYNGTDSSMSSPLGVQGAKVDEVYIHAIRGFSVSGVDDPSIFANDPDIEIVEPVIIGETKAQYVPTGIARIGSLDTVTEQYRPGNTEQVLNVDVAVIDQRVEPNHPDLNLITTNSFLPSTWFTVPRDHGTHVAGIVGARDNLGGVAGVAPGARIHSLAVCGSTQDDGTSDGCTNLVSAVNYVTANAATFEVATMSIGCVTPDRSTVTCDPGSAMTTAVNNMVSAGVTFILAAGNEFRSADNLYCGFLTNAICVSALGDTDGKCGGLGSDVTFGSEPARRDDSRAHFSNFGSSVDIMAPGYRILSTVPFIDETQTLPYIGTSIHGDYVGKSGTSMAAPHVAGAAALVKLSNPSFTPAQVRTALLDAAYSQTTTCDGNHKGGLVQGANSDSSEPLLWVAPF